MSCTFVNSNKAELTETRIEIVPQKRSQKTAKISKISKFFGTRHQTAMEEDSDNPQVTRRTAVVVLGDVGRSPRMQYHCISLASTIKGMEVDLVGYSGKLFSLESIYCEGSECCKEVRENPRIHQRLLPPPSVPYIFNFLFIFRAIYKVLVQFFSLLWMLMFTIPKPGN